MIIMLKQIQNKRIMHQCHTNRYTLNVCINVTNVYISNKQESR